MAEHSRQYDRYMKSQEWQAKRQQRLEIDSHVCVMCGRPEAKCKNGLQVHHISYKRLGNESVYADLITLCPRCHRMIHRYYQRIRQPPAQGVENRGNSREYSDISKRW